MGVRPGCESRLTRGNLTRSSSSSSSGLYLSVKVFRETSFLRVQFPRDMATGSTGIAEVMGSNSLQALIFSVRLYFRNCSIYVHNCDDLLPGRFYQ